MDSAPQHQVYSLSAGEDIHRTVRQLRLVGGLIVLALLLVIIGIGTGLIFRLAQPREGGLSAVVFSGLLGVIALAGGLAVLEVTDRRAKRAETLEQAVTTYRTGCMIAGGANFIAGLCTVIVILANGLDKGLWLPQVLIAAMNILGLILAVPRIKHLRKLHYRPTLPYSRV